MSLVALGLQPSLHAAAQKMGDLPVSLTALYDTVNRVEPNVVQARVRGSAERLAPVMSPLRRDVAPWLPGWRVRIVDGNHLPASEKRLTPLRGFRGAALPGHSLVVFDPDAGLVVDPVPCEDGHASDLWLGDRHFCTAPAIRLASARGVAMLVRSHCGESRSCSTSRRRTATP